MATIQSLLNTVIAPLHYIRGGYRGYAIRQDRDCAGVPFLRILTPLGDACGYATTPRAAVRLVSDVLALQKATGHLPPSAVLYGPGSPEPDAPPRLQAMYFNPERRDRDAPEQE